MTDKTRPAHYRTDEYEVFKVLEAWLTREELIGYHKGSMIKYLARAGRKPGESAPDEVAKVGRHGEVLHAFLASPEECADEVARLRTLSIRIQKALDTPIPITSSEITWEEGRNCGRRVALSWVLDLISGKAS